MSKLTALRDKDPKEVVRLLSVVSSSLLPNPRIEEVIHQTGRDPEFVRAILSEIRKYLRVPEDDQSIKTQSQIHAFLSQEISRAVLTGQAVSNVKARLGNRGELHPSQYEVSFQGADPEEYEATGLRQSNIIEAVTHPDNVVNIKAKYLLEDRDPRTTISIKFVATKRADDNFIVLVVTTREGYIQTVRLAVRVYHSDVKLNDLNDPVEITRSFVNNFGLTFKLGDSVSRFMFHEPIRLERSFNKYNPLDKNIKALDKPKENIFGGVVTGGETGIKGPGGEYTGEVVLGFIFDMSTYLESIRKHHVNVRPDAIQFLLKMRQDRDSR